MRNPDTPRGFFNEYLSGELTDHRKTLEMLGDKMRVEDSNNQLCGLGFSDTVRNELIIRTQGDISKQFKIKF